MADKKHNYKYFQFPILLLKGFSPNNKHQLFNSISAVGIYQLSQNIQSELKVEDIARQISYDYYNNKLSNEIKNALQYYDLEYVGQNEDYRGFDSDGQFNPVEEIEELRELFGRSSDLCELCSEHYRMHLALNVLNVTSNIDQDLKTAKKVLGTIEAKAPQTMISKDMFFKFRDYPKSDYDFTQLLGFLAIKSIVGKRESVKTNIHHILARMQGYSSQTEIKKHSGFNPLLAKYYKRYHMDRLLDDLELNWNVVRYSRYMRGLQIGIGSTLTHERLAQISESKRRSYQIKQLAKSKEAAYRKFKGEPPVSDIPF